MLSMFQKLSRLATYGRCRGGGWGTSGRVFGFPLPSQQDTWLGVAESFKEWLSLQMGAFP